MPAVIAGRGRGVDQQGVATGSESPRWRVFGGAEPASTVFLAANGFPVGSYRFLLEPLSERRSILAFDNRGAWPEAKPPKQGFTWASHADDLIAFLEARRSEQTAEALRFTSIGHSIGGTVSALAAMKRPDLFERLILIDPATIPGRWMPLAMRLLPNLAKKMDLVTRTRNRRYQWTGPEQFARFLRGKSVYKRFTEQALTDYAEAGLAPGGKSYELVYDREWEAWNFQHTAALWPVVHKLRLPTLILRAEHSYLHPESDFKRHCRRLPANITPLTIAGAGHMLPQEDPAAVLSAIEEWLTA